MKGGVRINNYVDNRVVLSGRKVKNQMQAVVQSHRPKPLIIHHINYIEPLQPYQEENSPKPQLEHLSGKKKRKRTRTVAINNNNNDQKSAPRKNRVSVSLEHLRKGMTSAKKKSASSSPSKESDQFYLNETQRKLKPVYKNNTPSSGLGKRCKSAIIKRNKSPERCQEKAFKKNAVSRDVSSNQNNNKKKVNQSQPSSQNKKQGKKRSSREKEKKVSSSKGGSVNTSIKKVGSMMHLQLNKKREGKESTKISGRKTSRYTSKSYATSAKQSKPVSARENHKNNIKKKLFEAVLQSDQLEGSDQGKASQQINLKNLLERHEDDEAVKKMIEELECALNSIGSRKKLTRDLEIITQNLKALGNEEEQQQEEDEESFERFQIKQEKNSQQSPQRQIFHSPVEQKQIEHQNKPEQQMEDHQGLKHWNEENSEGHSDAEEEKWQKEEENQQLIYQEGQVVAQEGENQKERTQTPKKVQEGIQEGTPYQEIQLQPKQHEVYERVVNYEGFLGDDPNPMLDRRGFGQVDMSEYDSIKSQDERQSQISLLKKFQQESDLMMRKVKKKLEIEVSEEQNKEEDLREQQAEVKEKEQKQSSEKTPINAEKYAFEKFPASPTAQNLKSPKFSENSIAEVIKLKEKVLSDRHQKLGELVNTLYSKHVVSPKTHSLHLNSLQKKYEEENQMLENHRKHAEELAKLLSDIKKEREQIHGIDELIRSEKWEEAMGVIKSHQPEPRPVLPRQQSARNPDPESSESEHEIPLYYQGEPSDSSEPGFKLIRVSEQSNDSRLSNESSEQRKGEQNQSSLIRIDENDYEANNRVQENVQKGFDSNLFFIKQYCISLCEYVRDHHKEDFKRNLSYPAQFDLEQLLEGYRTQPDGSRATKLNSLYENLKYHECFRKSICPPISEVVFDQFNQTYENIKHYGKKQTQDAALQGIFLRSIFNALNQSISMERPGSQNGKPLPWAHSSKHLKNMKNSDVGIKPKNQEEEDMIFGIAVARIIQWGSCLCGFIPDTVELQNTEIDEEYINHIRETRMALLLEKMLSDEEASMNCTELEDTEVMLQLGQIIYEELLKEASSEVRKIEVRNALRMVDY